MNVTVEHRGQHRDEVCAECAVYRRALDSGVLDRASRSLRVARARVGRCEISSSHGIYASADGIVRALAEAGLEIRPVEGYVPCPVPSSVSDEPCMLRDGHPADTPYRFHRYPRPA
jgi:hypothetical protein